MQIRRFKELAYCETGEEFVPRLVVGQGAVV